MKFATLTTERGHGIECGCILNVAGRQAEVVAVSGTTITIVFIPWWRRLWRWMARQCQFRGFWSRVWNR